MVREGLRSAARATKVVAKSVGTSVGKLAAEEVRQMAAAEDVVSEGNGTGRKRRVATAVVVKTEAVQGAKKASASAVVKEEAKLDGGEVSLGPLSTFEPLVRNLLNGSPVNTGLKYVGAHVSAAGNLNSLKDSYYRESGISSMLEEVEICASKMKKRSSFLKKGSLETAIANALSINAKSFAFFLASQRQWTRKPLEQDVVVKFREAVKSGGFSPHLILPHGSYLMNLGSPKQETLQKSRDLLLDELIRCERLGITQFNLHPGSTCGEITREECIALIAEGINVALEKTKFVVVLLENMSKQGHTIGGDFAELKAIIDLIKDKSRIGVCLDTCHAFAAGYDLRTSENWRAVIKSFDDEVGLKYLKAMHINDSQGDLGCRRDRHENIGRGKIGKAGFVHLMNMPEFNDIPLVLETPWESDATYEREIKILNGLIEK